MKISQAIEKIKAYHCGISRGEPIDPGKTRDQVLYGDPDRELKGVVTTCFATVEVIRRALETGANLIVCHEALFWNHGDRTDWLQENKTFLEKKALLDEGGIVVWRDHDYMHAGIPLGDGQYADGIFYGFMKVLGWEEYLTGPITKPLRYTLPPTTVRELGKVLKEKLNLTGIKLVGDPDAPVRKVWLAEHIGVFGGPRDKDKDNDIIRTMEEEDVDAVITLECTDNTVVEYVRDSSLLGRSKTVLATGHFNTEEPGMRYMVEWLPAALGESVPAAFVPCADMYRFL